MPPGVWSDYGTALRKPVGRIHWAGTKTSEVFNGYMDGAVRSGERAAREVRTELGTVPPRGVLDPVPFLTKQEDDVTPEEVKQAVRDVLNEATAPGQLSGTATLRATLEKVEGVTNRVEEVFSRLAAIEEKLNKLTP